MEHLSNIELYYSEPKNFSDNSAMIMGDEYRHITKVMRHKIGDVIYFTNGLGNIYSGRIDSITKSAIMVKIDKKYQYENKFKNIYLCLPKLKSPDRFEFAIEKCVELGITNLIIYDSKRAVAKGSKIGRWNKVALSAMKQSLRSYLPKLNEYKSIEEIIKIDCEVIIFEQNSEINIEELNISATKKYYFVFGPEGGLDQEELDFVNKSQIYSLAENRLRTETALVKFASILSSLF